MRFLIFIAFLGFTHAFCFSAVSKDEWNNFKAKYNKVYEDSGEEDLRFKIYFDNRQKIEQHNMLYYFKQVDFKMDINKYADMLTSEVKSLLNGFNRTTDSENSVHVLENIFEDEEGATFIEAANIELPTAVDWRKKGAVTPIKDQGQCGSCWSFSATGSLESQHFRKTGKLVSLSEQNLVDCSDSFGNMGCMGGLMDNAFKYIKYNKGIDTELSYPYRAYDESCRFKKENVGATDNGFVDITSGDENALQNAVATVGCISVAIDASHDSFQFYSSGIYYEPKCSRNQLDHGVLVVGYDSDGAGKDYWIVKNSWGTSWGDQGYIKMARNRQNNCGIATAASYPLV